MIACLILAFAPAPLPRPEAFHGLYTLDCSGVRYYALFHKSGAYREWSDECEFKANGRWQRVGDEVTVNAMTQNDCSYAFSLTVKDLTVIGQSYWTIARASSPTRR